MRRTVCLDLDGTLAYYDGWDGLDKIGDPIPGAVEFTKKLSEYYEIIIFTCRCTKELHRIGTNLMSKYVKDWLDKHGFAYDDIYVGQGKPVADAYIDDRAVSCRPQRQDKGFEYAEYDAVLADVLALSKMSGIPDKELELIESRKTICHCIIPRTTEEYGECKRCGKPLTIDYER